jgi:sulfur-carrier protein
MTDQPLMQVIGNAFMSECTEPDDENRSKMLELFPMTSGGQPHNELTIYYFSWVRENIGKESERVLVPPSVTDISDLIDWLILCGGETYARAFENRAVVRSAIDRCHVAPTTSLQGAKEIAFFPPVTGG